MKAKTLYPTVAATMAVLMLALTAAPAAQAVVLKTQQYDNATVFQQSTGTSMGLAAFDAQYPGASTSSSCPPPVLQCVLEAVSEYCGNSPTCTLVINVLNYVIVVTWDLIEEVLDIAFWAVDLALGVASLVLELVWDLVDDVNDFVAHLTAYVIAMVFKLYNEVWDIYDKLCQIACPLVSWVLDYVGQELAALEEFINDIVYIVVKVVQDECKYLLGNLCPLFANKTFTFTANSDLKMVQPATSG